MLMLTSNNMLVDILDRRGRTRERPRSGSVSDVPCVARYLPFYLPLSIVFDMLPSFHPTFRPPFTPDLKSSLLLNINQLTTIDC